MGPLAFISYRRDDVATAARYLEAELEEAYGPESVFMDTERLRVGDRWATKLDEALARSTALLVVIGTSWLRLGDEYGRRRLDKDGDWVRREIEHALGRKIVVVPVLMGRATLPPRDALPLSITGLVDQQAISIRESHWKSDLLPLVQRLEEVGFRRRGTRYRFPKPPDRVPRPLSDEEVAAELAKLPDWSREVSPLPGEHPKVRTEITRAYKFRSFEDAVDFMRSAAEYVSAVDHHPRWENLWRTVRVWLSTWDAGHLPSRLDIELAAHFDKLFEAYRDKRAAHAEAGAAPDRRGM